MAQLMPLPLTVSCFSKIQIVFTFLVPARSGSPGKRAVKRVLSCVVLLSISRQAREFLNMSCTVLGCYLHCNILKSQVLLTSLSVNCAVGLNQISLSLLC